MPYRTWLLIVFLVVLPVSLIGATAGAVDIVLLHIPTVLFLVWLVWVSRPEPLDDRSYTLIFLFMLLHLVGSRYLYTNVPYETWGGMLGLESNDGGRNHYDRFVHFLFGVLMVHPAAQLLERRVKCSYGMRLALAVGVVVVAGTFYELLEWLVAVTLSPETAENYNGQQGDPWDPQKDMLLALGGALLAAGASFFSRGD